jgi:hypothetical protein
LRLRLVARLIASWLMIVFLSWVVVAGC